MFLCYGDSPGKNTVVSCNFLVVLECSLKNDRMISAQFQGKPFNITVNQVYYASSTNTKDAEAEWFYEDPVK